MSGKATVTVKDKQWDCDLATLPWELTKGLGGLPSIPAGTGMLFDLGSDGAIQVTTQPMLFNLDILFISSSLVVVDIAQNVPPGNLVQGSSPARYFLEVNAGETEGIALGDQVTITVTTPPSLSMTDLFNFLLYAGVIVAGVALIIKVVK